jgi:HlyD family secretion protein
MSSAATQVPVEPPITSSPSEKPQPQRPYWAIGLVVVVLVVVLTAWLTRQKLQQDSGAPRQRTAVVKRGEFVRSIRVSGTVEATRSYIIAAPTLNGQQFGTLTVTRMVRPGSRVKKGDLLVEFDRQNQIKNALDRKTDYEGLIEQIKKKQADQAIARAQDDTDLKTAEDAERAAELEVSRNEVLSRIDAEKNLAALEEAKANLKQLRATFDLKRIAAQADLKSLQIQCDRARQEMVYSQRNSEKMVLRSPVDGVVVLNSIWKSSAMGEVQEGDDVRSGVPFMQVMDPSSMEVRSRINQADIGYLHPGQEADIYLDAYPSVHLRGTLQTLSGVGTISNQSNEVRTYTALFKIDTTDPKLMPDLTAAVDIRLEQLPDVLSVPRDAVQVTQKESFVYVKSGSGWDKREVKSGAMNETEEVVLSGLTDGDVVERNPEIAMEPVR